MKRLLILLYAVFFAFYCFSQAPAYPTEFSNRLASGDWQFVYSAISDSLKPSTKSNPCTMSAVSRFLLGHAAMNVGKNNISTKQFYAGCDSVGSPSVSAWLSFTNSFCKQYPTVVSYYLVADALARNAQFTEAKAAIDSALWRSAKDVPSLNLRAVVTWTLSEKDSLNKGTLMLSALEDIEIALALRPNDYADLYANKGLFLLRIAGDTFARSYLASAVAIDSSYFLAYNSIAASFGMAGQTELYADTVRFILSRSPNTPFIGRRFSESSINSNSQTRGSDLDAGIGFEYKKMLGPSDKNNLPDISKQPSQPPNSEIKITGSLNSRGGFYSPLIAGGNLVENADGSPVLIGAGFIFNYPIIVINNKK